MEPDLLSPPTPCDHPPSRHHQAHVESALAAAPVSRSRGSRWPSPPGPSTDPYAWTIILVYDDDATVRGQGTAVRKRVAAFYAAMIGPEAAAAAGLAHTEAIAL